MKRNLLLLALLVCLLPAYSSAMKRSHPVGPIIVNNSNDDGSDMSLKQLSDDEEVHKKTKVVQNIPLVMIFESSFSENPYSAKNAMHNTLCDVLTQNAAPLIISKSIFYNYLITRLSAATKSNVYPSQLCKYKLLSPLNKWRIYSAPNKDQSQLCLVIPHSYEPLMKFFNIEKLKEIKSASGDFLDVIEAFNPIINHPPLKASDLELFIRTPPEKSDTVRWNVYLSGHGSMGGIANIPVGTMKEFLTIFETGMSTGILMIDSCYIGSHIKLFDQSYSFPIVAMGVPDVSTIYVELNFQRIFSLCTQLNANANEAVFRALLHELNPGQNLTNIPSMIVPANINIQGVKNHLYTNAFVIEDAKYDDDDIETGVISIVGQDYVLLDQDNISTTVKICSHQSTNLATVNYEGNILRQYPTLFDLLEQKPAFTQDILGNTTCCRLTYPAIISRVPGDSKHSFKKIVLATPGNAAVNPALYGVLHFIRDAFLKIKGRKSNKTFLIEELEGPNDIYLILKTARMIKGADYVPAVEERFKDAPPRIILKNVVINTLGCPTDNNGNFCIDGFISFEISINNEQQQTFSLSLHNFFNLCEDVRWGDMCRVVSPSNDQSLEQKQATNSPLGDNKLRQKNDKIVEILITDLIKLFRDNPRKILLVMGETSLLGSFCNDKNKLSPKVRERFLWTVFTIVKRIFTTYDFKTAVVETADKKEEKDAIFHILFKTLICIFDDSSIHLLDKEKLIPQVCEFIHTLLFYETVVRNVTLSHLYTTDILEKMLALEMSAEKKHQWIFPMLMRIVTTATHWVPGFSTGPIVRLLSDHERQIAKKEVSQALTSYILTLKPESPEEAQKLVSLLLIMLEKDLIDPIVQEKLFIMWAQVITNPQSDIEIYQKVFDTPQTYAPLLFSTLAYIANIPPAKKICYFAAILKASIKILENSTDSEQIKINLKNIISSLITHKAILTGCNVQVSDSADAMIKGDLVAIIKSLVALVEKMGDSVTKNTLLQMLYVFMTELLPLFSVKGEDRLLLCLDIWKLLVDRNYSYPCITVGVINYLLPLLEQVICSKNWQITTLFTPIFEKLIGSIVKNQGHALFIPVAQKLLSILSDHEDFMEQYEAQKLLEKIIDAVPCATGSRVEIWVSLHEAIFKATFTKTYNSTLTKKMLQRRLGRNIDYSQGNTQLKQGIDERMKKNAIYQIQAQNNIVKEEGVPLDDDEKQSIQSSYAAQFIHFIEKLENPLRERLLNYYVNNIPQIEFRQRIREYAESIFGGNVSTSSAGPSSMRVFRAGSSGAVDIIKGNE
jgi:hypothetical protein